MFPDQWLKWRSLGVFLLLAICMTAWAAEKRPAVLFVNVVPTQLRTWEDWLASGFEVDARDISAIKSVADLKPFNVVFIMDLPVVDGEGQPHKAQPAFEKALDDFLQQGGGVIVAPPGSGFANVTQAANHLLKPYGARIPEEQITDPQHIFGTVGGSMPGCFTTRIEAAPMTKGVTRLGYLGVATRADCIETTMPVVFTDQAAWKVAVRGEESAYSAEGKNPGSTADLKDTPASYAASPVLAAYREVGRGRLFVCPITPAVTVSTPEVFLNVLWNPRDQTEPEALQDRTLFQQAVRWAAEPTLAGNAFGGYLADRNFHYDEKAILQGLKAPIDWSKIGAVDKLAPKLNAQRGLVGAQSTYSGGAHTVAELCQAAKAAGLQFLGFTEKLEMLTPATWEKLKADCATQSDANFLALPGLIGLDKEGNTWFGLGWITFPAAPALTTDSKRIDNTYYLFDRVFKGRLYGFARVGRNPNPWFEMKQASAFAVYTQEPGQPLDNMEAEYLKSCTDMENYIPLSVTLLTTPQAVGASARGVLNVFTGPSVKALEDYARGEGSYQGGLYWPSPHAWYLTRGPQLVYHGGYNLGNLDVDEEKENLYRYGFKLAGLQPGDRVVLYDGTR
ncbi:MAG TPA: hypothetical protein VGM23_09155, partial [Armatimonadota bacterium]